MIRYQLMNAYKYKNKIYKKGDILDYEIKNRFDVIEIRNLCNRRIVKPVVIENKSIRDVNGYDITKEKVKQDKLLKKIKK